MAAVIKIVIAGSRSIKTLQYVIEAMEQAVRNGFIQPAYSFEIVSGGAVGVDTLAREYAQRFGYAFTEYKPDYTRYKGYAPLQRNTTMAQYGDLLIAVWDGSSRGTQHMIGEMEKLNKPVFIYRIP